MPPPRFPSPSSAPVFQHNGYGVLKLLLCLPVLAMQTEACSQLEMNFALLMQFHVTTPG